MRRNIRIILVAALVLLLSALPLFGEEGQNNSPSNASENIQKPRILLLSLKDDKVPSYITKVIDKILLDKIENTGVYTVITQESVNSILTDQGYPIPEKNNKESALLLGLLVETDQVMFGTINMDGDSYIIESTIVESNTENILFSGTEKASSLKGIEPALKQMTKNLVAKIFPPAVVDEVIDTMDIDETEKMKTDGNMEDFSTLAEKDPEKALEMVAEPARAAIKDVVREEIVEEEVQNLYEKKKIEENLTKRRNREFWIMFGLKGFNQIGNLAGSAAAVLGSSSLSYWSDYMNENFACNNSESDSYQNYKSVFEAYQGFQGINYLFSSGSNFGLAISSSLFLDNAFSFSNAGRHVYALSYLLNIAGNAVSVYTNSLVFQSSHLFSIYNAATNDLTTKYAVYKEMNAKVAIPRYITYGLWGAGLAGMLTSSVLPGERSPMIVSNRARVMLTIGGAFLGLGNVSSSLAVNYQSKAETSWVNNNSKLEWVGPNLYDDLKLTSEILNYSSYGLFTIGGVLTYLALILPAGTAEDIADSEDFTFSIVPDGDGFGTVVSWRY